MSDRRVHVRLRLHHAPSNVAVYGSATRGQHIADRVAAVMGSIRFIVWMTIFIVLWIALNIVGLGMRWDAYPFILLNLCFSAQATYAAPLILLSQNRAAEHDRLEAEAAYDVGRQSRALQDQQIELLTEIRDAVVPPAAASGK